MTLQYDFEVKEQVLIIRLHGELDHHEASALKDRWQKKMITHRIHDVVLNVGNLTFMDSSGIGVILGRYKEITAAGGELIICSMNPGTERLFQLSGLFKIIRYEEKEEHALYSLGGVR